MKFGSQLKANRAPHWKYHFVDYDGLKAHLKSRSHGREFTDQDEADFVKLLNAELEKVTSFQTMKLGEVQRRTEHCEFTIRQHQLPSGKSSEKLTLASFVVTESEINKITQDLQDLAHFQRLNYTAFLKIIKKHDKHTGFILRAHFMNFQLNSFPFHKESFAPLVSRLSTLYNIVRTGTAPTVTKAQSIDSEEDEELEHPGCISKKTAFWVHPDSIMDLKMLILKYLPLVVYEPTPALNSSHRSTSQLSSYLASESPVSTVYLDNADFDLYMSQVEHRDRSETVRLRWYGSEQRQLWVEHQQRSIHSNNGSSSPSSSSLSSSSSPGTTLTPSANLEEPIVTKHRFQIKSKNVPKLLQGSAKIDKMLEQLRLAGQKTEQEIQEFEASTRIVQSRIKRRGLQPVTQTFFNRTAFQVPGDARVRITIDTDVVMVREKALEPSDLFERPWVPTDLQAENYPFSQVPEHNIVRFPYAIMQVRTLTEPQEEIPSWVYTIGQSHLVEMVPNFTKDQHAIATLYESRVGLLPFWLSDMDRDIRKPAMLTGGFSDRSSLQDSNSNSGSNGSSGGSTDATTISDTGSPSSLTRNSKSNGKNKSVSSSPRRSGPSSKQDQQQDTNIPPGVTFDEEVQDLVAVSRMMIERQEGAAAAFVDAQKKKKGPPPLPKVTRPVVSCLKKKGSDTSLQSRNGRYESGFRNGGSSEGYGSSSSASSTASLPTSSTRRRRKRVTFKRSTARRWFDHLSAWIPFMSVQSGYDNLDDLESQQQHQFVGEDESFWSSLFSSRNHYYYGSSGRRYSANSLFWTGLTVVNVGLLFVGLVLALMNLGDGIGMEAASIFLVVSCLCMGTSVWAHLIRMDGQSRGEDDEEEEQDPDVMPYSTTCISTKNNVNERTGLLARSNSSSSVTTQQQYRSQGRSLFKTRWVRRRLLPVVTFLCLFVVVGLNALARAYPASEEIGSD
ncbi:vacuolar transporter chaperone [Linnemannia gamsii]|uniref:Vacuolar transporter chaperone n=1 Tax=Linnemannia gamsii TaxID=64522 RepID=A0ABQ7JL05_9FUNG|nr:vacuolar transporter chaperone [Linnemannia gamsii]